MNPIITLPFSKAEGPAPGLTFDTFAVGDSNRAACLAAKAAADGTSIPGAPLILCGGTGVGKTHLLHAIHAQLLIQNPSAVILRMTADDFVSRLINAIHNRTETQFRSDCEYADVFLLDDIQFLSGKERTQEEVALILEARCRANRLSVITADCTAEEAEAIKLRLADQFPDIAVVPIKEAGGKIRAHIVRAKAVDLELALSEEDIDLIVQQVPGSLRNIHGILNRIRFYRDFPDAFPETPTVAEIIAAAKF